MADENEFDGLRERLTRQGEDALGKLAQDLLSNPLVSSAITRAFDAREKATQAQEVAFGALNIPSAADLERLTRRVRSVSQRLEGIEDGVDRLDERLAGLNGSTNVEQRLDGIEDQLDKITKELRAIHKALPAAPTPVPQNQERLQVSDDKG
jgi:chromosome segregation ATPase